MFPLCASMHGDIIGEQTAGFNRQTQAAQFDDTNQVTLLCAAHVKSMATDQYAHLVLITSLSRVDDTALLRKNIVTELQVGAA